MGGYALIYSVKMHEKAYFLAVKGLFYCLKALNYVHYTIRYTRITLEVHESYMLIVWAAW